MKVLVTKPFKLNLGIVDGLPKIVEYASGTQDMPDEHFKHWWAKRHSVESLESAGEIGDTAIPNSPSPPPSQPNRPAQNEGQHRPVGRPPNSSQLNRKMG